MFQSSRNGEYRVSGAEVQTPRPGDQGFVGSILNGAVDSGSWSREQAQRPRSMPRSMPQTRGDKAECFLAFYHVHIQAILSVSPVLAVQAEVVQLLLTVEAPISLDFRTSLDRVSVPSIAPHQLP